MIYVKLPQAATNVITEAFFKETPDSYLGAGISATVYRGTVRFADGQEAKESFVFKVPHSHDHDPKIQEEFDILNRIAELSRAVHPQQRVFTPEPFLGYHPVDDRLILIMPFYETRLQDAVRDELREGQFIKAENLALQAMIDFSYTMQALHDNGHGGTSPDRKLKDFYWSQSHQLTVIDWNVQRPYTLDNLSAEMGIIGQLYHELFLGSKGRSPYVPLDDNEWQIAGSERRDGGALSIGLRYILAHMVDSRYQYKEKETGLPNAKRLRDGLKAWQAFIADETLLLSDIAPFDALTFAEQEVIKADLRWRKAGASLSGDLLDQRKNALQNVFKQRSQVVNTVANVIKQDISEAQKIIENYEINAGNYQEWGHLQRWSYFTDLVLSRDRNLRPFSEKLHEIWNLLARPFAADANPHLPAEERLTTFLQTVSGLLENDLPERERQPLKIIQAEIWLRQLVVDYKAQKGVLSSEQKLERLKAIQDLIRLPQYVLPLEAPQKSATLLGSVLDIDQERFNIEEEKHAKENVETKIHHLLSILDTYDFIEAKRCLAEYLNDFGSKTYPEIKQRALNYERLIRFGEQTMQVVGLFEKDLVQARDSLIQEFTHILRQIPNSNELPTQDLQNWVHNLLPRTESDLLKLSVPLLKESKAILTSLLRESPSIQKHAEIWVYKLQGDMLVRIAQVLQQSLVTPTYDDYKWAGKAYRIIRAVSTNNLPDTTQIDIITQATDHYESIDAFYKKWIAHFSDSPKSDTQQGFEANVQWFFKERVDKVSEFMNEATQLGITIDDMIDALKRGSFREENITLKEVLTLGFQAFLKRETVQDAETLAKTLREEIVEERFNQDKKKFDEKRKEYVDKSVEIEGYLSSWERTQKEIKNLSEKINEQISGLTIANDSNNTLLDQVESLKGWKSRVDTLFDKLKSIHQIEAQFRQRKIAEITKTLDELDAYCAQNPNTMGIGLIEQQILYWYNQVKSYKHLEYILTHPDNALETIRSKAKSKDKLFDLYASYLRQLEDLMYNSDSLIFGIWYKEWQGQIERIRSELNHYYKKQAGTITTSIDELLQQGTAKLQSQKKVGN